MENVAEHRIDKIVHYPLQRHGTGAEKKRRIDQTRLIAAEHDLGVPIGQPARTLLITNIDASKAPPPLYGERRTLGSQRAYNRQREDRVSLEPVTGQRRQNLFPSRQLEPFVAEVKSESLLRRVLKHSRDAKFKVVQPHQRIFEDGLVLLHHHVEFQ